MNRDLNRDLNEAERRLWAAFPRGATVDLSGADPDGGPDPTADGVTADAWPPDRRVRGEVVTRLLLGMADAAPGQIPRLVLAGARITGRLDLGGATVGYRLHLERCWLDEAIDTSDAKVRAMFLVRCRVPALDGWGMDVDGPLSLTDSRIGRVGLASATVAGRLHLTQVVLSNIDGYALVATKFTAAQSVLAQNLVATGEVRFLDAQVGGALLLDNARLANPGGAALNLEGVRVEQSLHCDQGFTAVGDLRLARMRVGSQLVLDADVSGTVDLSDAQIQTVILRSERAGPARLDGLTYADLKPDEPALTRLAWLRLDPDGYRDQPYEQLARHYRRLGHDGQARRVLLAKRRAYRTSMPRWRRWGGFVMDAMAGYGYVPARALAWLTAAWLAGWCYFATVDPGPGTPALYALDVLVPTSPFGLEGEYRPHDAGRWVAVGMQALGWALSLAVLPALTRAFNRS